MRECNIFLNCFILVSLVIFVWIQTSDACGGMLKSEEGVITSPRYPYFYPPYQLCIWEIEAPPKHRIALKFRRFRLEFDANCSYDSVSIFSRFSENSEWSHEGKYCGSQLPFVVVSKGNVLRIEFRSDSSVQDKGFSVLYRNDGGIENAFGDATDSTDVSFETTTEWFSTETDWYATETTLYRTETDWDSSETQSIPLSQTPLTHPVSGSVVSTVKPTAGCFDENEPSRSNPYAGSVMLPILLKYLLQSQSARETSPVSNTARDQKYLPASPRNYVDISINFPLGQRWPAPDTPLPIDRRPIQNQGMGIIVPSVPDYLKSKTSSAQFERGYDRFSVDTQDRNDRKSDEELSLRYADESYSQTDYVPRPLIALFLFPKAYPINIRVNG